MITKKILTYLCITTVLSAGLIGCSSPSVKSKSIGEAVKTQSVVADVKVQLNWEALKTKDIPHPNTIGGFYNENFGITVGPSGEVHYTNDGGTTWLKSNNNSLCRFGLYILNEKVAWNCGDGGNVRKTIDGGKNWLEVTDFGESQPNHCKYLSFINEQVGWIASIKKLGVTNDGGAKWSEIKLPSGISDIFAINLLNEKTGYLVDTNSKLYTTNDGGLSWNTKDINPIAIDTTVWPAGNSALKFTDEKNGRFFYFSKDTKINCLNTKDSGNTWDKEIIPDMSGDTLNLSSDGKLLNINSVGGSTITIFKHN